MQTTVEIDPDVELLLQEAARGQQKSMDEVLNDVLRRGLSGEAHRRTTLYSVQPRPLGIKSAVELDRALQVAENLEDQEIIRKLREGR